MNNETPLTLYKMDQVMGILNLSRTMVYRLVWDGKLKQVKIGRSIRFRSDHVQEFLDGLAKS